MAGVRGTRGGARSTRISWIHVPSSRVFNALVWVSLFLGVPKIVIVHLVSLRIHENWGDLGKDTPYPMMNESLMFRLPGLHSGMVLVHDTCGMPQPESGRYTAGSSELSYQAIRQLQFAPRTSQGLVHHLRASWTRRGALGARNSQDLIWFACGKLYKC